MLAYLELWLLGNTPSLLFGDDFSCCINPTKRQRKVSPTDILKTTPTKHLNSACDAIGGRVMGDKSVLDTCKNHTTRDSQLRVRLEGSQNLGEIVGIERDISIQVPDEVES